jgi:nucleotide-binding universal stress UspA family protein
MGNVKKKILAAVDGSVHSLEAVKYVGSLFPPEQVEVTLFTVKDKIPELYYDLDVNPEFHPTLGAYKEWALEEEKTAGAFMDKCLECLTEKGFSREAVTILVRERREGVARDIAKESLDGYDAVVVGKRGRSALKDLMLGSIATKLIGRLTHVPLWMVGGRPRPGKALVGFDGSEGAMAAVEYAAKMLAGSGSEIHLVHIGRSPDIYRETYEVIFNSEESRKWLDEAKLQVASAMEKAKSRLIAAGIAEDRVKAKVITGKSSRAQAIVDEAKEGDYGTIVLGRRGISKVEEFLIGRVGNKVLQLAEDAAVWIVS